MVELVDFIMNSQQDRIGVVALLKQHNAFHRVWVINDGPIGAMGGAAICPRRIRAPAKRGDVSDLDAAPFVVFTTVFSMSCTVL